jgi:uncharacterized caspase-like protein
MKRALLIGINQYPGQPLNGCVNDVTDIADYLVSTQGFASSDVRLLTDARATTDAIRDRIKWLVEGAAAADTLLLHYSGHGTLFPVRDAQGNVTAVHGAICPVDFDWSEPHVIFDSELRDLIDQAPAAVEFIFVSDSCHSGTLTRGFRPRVFIPPPDIAWRLRTARDIGLQPELLQIHDRCGFISGCREDQTSADAYIDNRYNGALTYYLLQSLKAGEDKLALTTLIANVGNRLGQAGYEQQPQLHGPDDIRGRGFLSH